MSIYEITFLFNIRSVSVLIFYRKSNNFCGIMNNPILQCLPAAVIDAKLQNLKCMICKLYLNVPPIMTSVRGNVCGRCYNEEDYTVQERPYHNRAYEALVKLFPFPCQYRSEGCDMRLCGDSLFEHEDMCNYRPYHCCAETCHWAGVVNGLEKHVKMLHPELYVVEGTVHLDITNEYNRQYLIANKKILILLRCRFDKNQDLFKFNAICISAPDPTNAYRLELAFKKHDPLDSSITFKTRFSNEPLQISGRILKLLLDEPEQLSVKISATLINSNNEDSANRALLSELECPVCNRYMVPPIYLCSNGHSICNCCKERVTNCPICRVELGVVHNHTLEQCVQQIRYPCKYLGNGCCHVALSTDIRIHEQLCHYAQTWANHLAHTNTFYYRNDKDVGQNLFCRPSNALQTDVSGQEVTSYWYMAVRQYDFSKEPDVLHANVNAGHFTQLVWVKSRHFGVGKARSRSGKVIVVANYSPTGNISGAFQDNVLPPMPDYPQQPHAYRSYSIETTDTESDTSNSTSTR